MRPFLREAATAALAVLLVGLTAAASDARHSSVSRSALPDDTRWGFGRR